MLVPTAILVAHRLELSSNHSRLNKGPRLAFSDHIRVCPDSGSTAGTGRCCRGLRAKRPSTAAPRTRIMLDRGDRRHEACAVAEVVRFRALTLDS
jgi:hypothetical protein